MANQVDPNLRAGRPAKIIITPQDTLDRLKTERGWLGQLWGTSSSIPNNIAAFVITTLTLTGLGYTLVVSRIPPSDLSLSIKDLWTIITPLITLAIGYLFGDKAGKSDNS